MRVLWPHNFDPRRQNAGVFMFAAAEGLRALGVDVQLQYLGNLRSPLNILRARRMLSARAMEFDLVHAQYGSACALATSAVKACPKVVSIRGNDWNLHSSAIGFLTLHTRLARMMTRLVLPLYDLTIAVSRRMENDLRRHIPGLSATTLPAPIDLELFRPMDKRSARAALGFPDNAERWVLFNALKLDDPIKRFALAERAVGLARQRLGNVRLRVASDIPHRDMPLFVSACDVILCTSETEGWPNSIKEALACDVPFVSTDVSDLRDIAEREPSCRIAKADPGVLADCICDVLASKAHPELRKYVLPMGMRETSEALLALYRGVIQGHGE